MEEWLADHESRRRVGGMIPFRLCFEHQRTTPGNYQSIAYNGQKPVGLTGFEVREGRKAAAILFVAPGMRNRGYGKTILSQQTCWPEADLVSAL